MICTHSNVITHCDITMSNDVAMCTYAMNIFYYIFSALCLIVLFYFWQYGIKTRTSSCLISLGWRTHSLFLRRAISLILWTHEISLHKHNSCVLPRLIKHLLVFVIILRKPLAPTPSVTISNGGCLKVIVTLPLYVWGSNYGTGNNKRRIFLWGSGIDGGTGTNAGTG